MSLRDIAEEDNNDGGYYLCHWRIDMHGFHGQFQQQVIEEKIKDVHHQVTDQLYPAPHGRITEDQVFHQEKAKGKRKAERNDEGRYVGFKSKEAEMKILFVENIFIDHEIKPKAHYGINSAAGGITERLYRHELPERRIKKIE